MKRSFWIAGLVVLFVLVLTACGGNDRNSQTAKSAATGGAAANASTTGTAEAAQEPSSSPAAAESGTRTIEYLGEQYTVPAKAERIVITGSMEAMEDALVLDVHPVGAITFGGAFPERFAAITDKAESIGEKTEPNFETILKLKPDVILGTTKFKPEVVEQLKKIAPLVQVSHIASNWEANLNLLAELTGKQEQAQAAIAGYQADLDSAKAQLGDKLKDKKVVALRIRAGQVFIFPAAVFVNPILYNDLGLTVPAEVEAAKAQEAISVEQLAAMNPDILFLQFAADENAETATALEELQNNPIIQKINAMKNDKTFVNVIDPLAEGGPAWSRVQFLKAAVEQLNK
ncbi:ABC transporter substrate-binding protein [Paenibacillus jilunlii]|uniref:Bacillibactin-binding protein n=1 Tax=Paenibacillus jilunlii TaxID=682956 RepID=A0A1G9G0J2_9BACL|nr:ABC transporter substrate-binding protein [Paenibacillus jilunlii]KWX71295.1 iron-uptake system-binding protein [Paenibacillus jilunlii]SDK94140.1 bacillibactin-binding protein [Paenibacillus jilunlii]